MNEQPKKKKHSLWWIWIILILAAFAGGIVTGLKLNTLPLPREVQGKLYPILESYIPGSTKTREPKSETPAETAVPEETPAPAETAVLEETIAPAETAVPEETAAPAVTEEPLETEAPKAVETEAPVETAAPAAVEPAAPAETQTPAVPEETVFEMSENESFAAEPQQTKYIGVNKALEIAMQNADPGDRKAEVSGVYRTKDDDGNPVYEVSFTVDENGYDYVIDAVSGEIMSWKLSGLSFSNTAAFGGGEETQDEAASE